MPTLSMTVAEFRQSLAGSAPPAALPPPLQALWHAARDEWDRAHALVQDETTRESAWVHAHLHRMEGDLANARYWYARASRSFTNRPLESERDAILATLLSGGG